jgi:hypothetical protein
MEFTRFAFVKAGLPGKVILRHDGVEDSREVRIVGGKMVAIFGEPKATIISRFKLVDSARSCLMTKRDAQTGALLSLKTMGFPALPDSQMDMAVLPSGTVIAGAYDGATGKWTTASPGQWHLGNELRFAPPFHGGLDKMSDCAFDLFTPAGKLNTAQCRFWRRNEMTKGGVISEARCDSAGKTEMIGIFADAATVGVAGAGMTYYPLDGAEGKALVETLRMGMVKGTEGFDMNTLKGITP